MKILGKLLATVLIAAAVPAASDAAVTINFTQVGANVTAAAAGTLNLTGLTSGGSFTLDVGVRGAPGYVGLGTSGAAVTGYTGFTGPLNFGPSASFVPTTSSAGTNFALNAFGNAGVFVPTGYTSGGVIASTGLFANTTLAGLGLTTGSYVFTSANDTITVNVGGAVPEPASWAMMIAGLGTVGFALRRRNAGATAKAVLA